MHRPVKRKQALVLISSRNEAYGWHFQYLTVIGLSLSTLTFMVGLLADLTMSAQLFLAKNLLSLCSAPMEVLISILYWSLRLVSAAATSVRGDNLF